MLNDVTQYAIDNKRFIDKFIVKLMKTEDYCGDIYNESIIKLLQYKKSVENISTFVHQVVKNEIYRFYKTNRLMKGSNKLYDVDFDLSHNLDPESLLIQREVLNDLNNSLDLIPERQAKTIRIVMNGGSENLKDLSKKHDINQNTFKANYRWGILKLKEIVCYKGFYIPEGDLVVTDEIMLDVFR